MLKNDGSMNIRTIRLRSVLSLVLIATSAAMAGGRGENTAEPWTADRAVTGMLRYFDAMSVPKPFLVRTGKDWEARRSEVRAKMLKNMNLDPLPERIPLDPHYSVPIEYPWCTLRKVAYQLWPGVYSRGLLYMPKELSEKTAPAVLCCHGHTDDGYADADEQRRYLTFAKMGFVTFVTPQDHHENLLRGYSNQTYMVWNNMRALDFLESLPEVDSKRLGVNGLSGGALQSQMLVALDPRLKAATIAGITTDFRESMFSYRHHCECNHWPDMMTFTDQPEISVLGFPAAVQYLTMDDWTAHFAADNFPTIQMIYRANGYPGRTECVYWPTEHLYDKVKRERTYWWMEKWVRGNLKAAIPTEPEDLPIVFPPKAMLADFPVPVLGERTFEAYVQSVFKRDDRIAAGVEGWKSYRSRMADNLRVLLGEAQALPAAAQGSSRPLRPEWSAGMSVEEAVIPSEGEILIPVLIIDPPPGKRNGAVEIYLSEEGRAVVDKEPGTYLARAKEGAVVVLPDLRFSGDYAVRKLAGRLRPELSLFKLAYPLRVPADPAAQALNVAAAWDRNGIVWGRAIPGMMVHDLLSVVDFLEKQAGFKGFRFLVRTKDTSALAAAALLSACLDSRIVAVDVDFKGHRYETAKPWKDDFTALPLVTRILRWGDIPQWAILLADRTLTLRGISMSAAERRTLEDAFLRFSNRKNLKIIG
jgi:hypothetical protein